MEKSELDTLLEKLESGEIEADEELLSLIEKLEEEKEEEIKEKRHSEMLEAIKNIKIETPPPVVEVPEIKVPTVVVPEIEIPPVIVPEIKVPEVKVSIPPFPKEISVKKPSWYQNTSFLSLEKAIKELKTAFPVFSWPTSPENPISVRLSDGKEFYKAFQEAIRGLSAFKQIASFRNQSGSEESGLLDDDRHVQVDIQSATSLEDSLDDANDKLQAIRDNQDTQINQLSDVTHTNTHTGNDELRVYGENHICAQNTTTTPLLGNGVFTGEWQDCLNYQEVNVSIISDKNSATNGLVFQWSADGVNIGDTDTFSYYTASGGTNYTPNPAFRYFRIIYTNGSVAQTSFSLQMILRRSMTGGSFHRIDSTLKDDADARLQITVPKLRTAANTYVSQTATTAGNAKVSIEEIESGVTIPVSAASLPLPSGAATSAKQDTLIGHVAPATTIYHGSKTVPTGTAEAIATTQSISSVTIKALSTNTVAVYAGASGVTTSGFELLAGESLTLEIDNLAKVYVISGSASQVIRYIAV